MFAASKSKKNPLASQQKSSVASRQGVPKLKLHHHGSQLDESQLIHRMTMKHLNPNLGETIPRHKHHRWSNAMKVDKDDDSKTNLNPINRRQGSQNLAPVKVKDSTVQLQQLKAEIVGSNPLPGPKRKIFWMLLRRKKS